MEELGVAHVQPVCHAVVCEDYYEQVVPYGCPAQAVEELSKAMVGVRKGIVHLVVQPLVGHLPWFVARDSLVAYVPRGFGTLG